MLKDKKILLGVTGSISAFKSCALASLLVKEGAIVRIILSQGGAKFVGAASFEGLTGQAVYQDIFEGKPDFHPHITLAQNWADVIMIYPASANVINRLAAGLADDLLGATILANNYNKPLLIAPAMNSEMFANPAVTESLEKISRRGAIILPTGEGRMACGTVGKGRLIEPDEAREHILRIFT